VKPTLTEQDFKDAATELRCDAPAIKAVCEVESPKGGFNPDDTLTTLFEAHKFSKYTGRRFDKTHPHLSSPSWNRVLYAKTWQGERARLAEASKLDPVAALMSTSWGRFQIMGFNHGACGYRDAADMVNDFATGERPQLLAFVEYIQTAKLDDELREHRWLPLAIGYNGPAAEANKYPEKLAAAYRKHGGA
jgi:hypothetical protein